MKRAKRWMAGLLGAVLLVSLLPVTALAADADPVTRAVLAEMVYNQFYDGQTAQDQGFTDIGPVEDGAEDPCTDAQRTAINVLVAAGVLSGSADREFHPHGEVTRAQVAGHRLQEQSHGINGHLHRRAQRRLVRSRHPGPERRRCLFRQLGWKI